MRHSATRALLERDDVIIVASVSCIYGIGSVETYGAMTQDLHTLAASTISAIMRRPGGPAIPPQRPMPFNAWFVPGARRQCLRSGPPTLRRPCLADEFLRRGTGGDHRIRPADRRKDRHARKGCEALCQLTLRDAAPHASASDQGDQGKSFRSASIQLVGEGKLLEAQRLEQRTNFDLEMLEATGSCNGIENYSRYLTGRAPGEPPPTLFEFIPDNALVFADESHVSVPQIGGMYRGDYRRKFTLAEHGFRLPSCMDNRPLKFEEWDAMRPQSVFVSATPQSWELEQTGGVFTEQVIRPTGLLDPRSRSAR